MKFTYLLADTDVSSVFGNGLSLGEKASLSLKMLLMGMGTVFAVLFIIWIVLTAFRLVTDGIRSARKEKNTVGTSDPATEVAAAVESGEDDDGAIIAAITAAVSAYRESEAGENGRTVPFRVVSFARSGSGPWKKDGER